MNYALSRAKKESSWSRMHPATLPRSSATAFTELALARVSVKDAVGEVAFATGRPRREVYQRALALAKDGDHGLPS
jgi:hypothetical protein